MATTEEKIDILLRIYDKCLKYGYTEPSLKYLQTPRDPKELFRESLENNELIKATYVFSRQPNSKAREVFLYFVYRLNCLDRKAFTDLLFSVYNMADTNSSFFTFYAYDTIIIMFSRTETPFTSKDTWNNYNSLPNELTIYRGLKSLPKDLNRCGFSWTLEQKIARDFAFQDNSNNCGYIVTGKVLKKYILAYLTNRGESEIIIAADEVRDKSILTINR
jgi:hypothetical protein